jgi:hypothetical protein
VDYQKPKNGKLGTKVGTNPPSSVLVFIVSGFLSFSHFSAFE